MAEPVAFSQSSLLLPPLEGPRLLTRWNHSRIRFRASSPVISCKSVAAGPRYTPFSSGILAAAVSDSTAPAFTAESAREEISIRQDTTDGDGSGGEGGKEGGDGGGSGGGGGGGHDDSDENKGGGGSEEGHNKMAMSMSQKLTLGYAALVGGNFIF